MATTERQWRDFSYCLSLLQFSTKSINKNTYFYVFKIFFYEISLVWKLIKFYLGIHRLIESLPLLKEKIHHKQVLKALHSVIEQTKKKPNTKAACMELEEKIKELLNKTENSKQDDEIMPPPPAPKSRKRTRHRKHSSSEEEEDDIDNDFDSVPVAKSIFLFI